ncbi:MAG: DUF3014 domain-containing protein [Gammaproteobacteria bacterium]|nr:DUF3014 domain-containing protein [Gammaproteobacteria bacterium]
MPDEQPLQRPVREISEDNSFRWMGLLLIVAIASLLYYKYGDNIAGVSIQAPFDSSGAGQPAQRELTGEPEPAESQPERFSAGFPTIPTNQEFADLDSSDQSIEQDINSRLNNSALLEWLGEAELIRKAVAVVDNAARGHVARKLLDLPAPNSALQVDGDAPGMLVDPQSYARYDDYVDMIMALDSSTLHQLYLQYHPLLQQAFAELGNPNPNFDDALAAACQIALDTPEISGSLLVQRVEGSIVFVDQEIEALPDLQKLLIRMGPDNRARVKRKIAEFQSILFRDAPVTG